MHARVRLEMPTHDCGCGMFNLSLCTYLISVDNVAAPYMAINVLKVGGIVL